MAEEQDLVEDEGVEVEVDKPEISESQEVEKEQESVKVEASEPAQEDELDNYSNKVQSRIKKLTEKYRKEERDREEAVRMAQQLLQENQQLKGQMQNLDKGYLVEYGNRLESQEAAVKQAYRQAHETGDTDAMFQAQEAMSRIAVEKDKQVQQQQQPQQRQQVQQQQQPPQQQAPAPAPDPKAQSWAEKNDWFGADEVMTYAAFGIHRKLVEEEGFDPETEEYYTKALTG